MLAPEDDEVERVELAGVLEGVPDERDQAEDEEVGRFRGGPAAEKDIQADRKVDERDEAHHLVVEAVGFGEDDLDVELNAATVAGGAQDRVGGVRPDAGLHDGALRGAEARGGVVVDGGEEVALADAGALGGGVGRD